MTAPLAETQARFCAWLRETDEDRAAELAAALGVDPAITVYQNNYRVSLVEALREGHPRLAAWLGEAAFEAAAAHQIDAHPPSSWTLDAYGAEFPDVIAALWPDDPVPADLAAIDRAIGEAFVAPDADPVDAAALGAVDWDAAVITPVPSLHRVMVRSNADALWLALAADEPAPDAQGAPGLVLVWRQGFEPVMRRADGDEALMLRAVDEGQGFGAICAGFAEHGDPAEAVTRAGTVLGRWLAEGLIAKIV